MSKPILGILGGGQLGSMLAMAAKKLGDQIKAKKYFEDLLKLTEGVDSDRAELEEAREYLNEI